MRIVHCCVLILRYTVRLVLALLKAKPTLSRELKTSKHDMIRDIPYSLAQCAGEMHRSKMENSVGSILYL